MRIVCVHVPDLSVQAVLRERFDDVNIQVPIALVEGPEERRRVVAASTFAYDCGVRPPQSLAAARGTCPELVVVPNNPEQTREALHSIADVLRSFGPIVSLAPPFDAFVDTTGVQGVDVSCLAIAETVRLLGFEVKVAAATTPFAAQALASHAATFEHPVEHAPGTTEDRAVGRLNLSAAGLPEPVFESLRVVGIRTVGAFMALPAASLSRRFGSEVRRIWRAAHGMAIPDLTVWEPDRPVVERSRHEQDPLTSLDPIAFRLKSLLDRALQRLEGRGEGVEELVVQLDVDAMRPDEEFAATRGGTVHTLAVDLGHASTDRLLLIQLLRERLSSRPPPGPVVCTTVIVTRSALLSPLQLDLFGDPAPRETIETTVARLAAILGTFPRFTPELHEDFRPERAWQLANFQIKAPKSVAALPPGPRPTRLLREPSPLDKPLSSPPPGAIAGPERLVTGWWDGEPIARDYWTIADRWGRRSWVFRDLMSNRWFVHGHFD